MSGCCFGAEPTLHVKCTEFDYYCLLSYAFSEKTNRLTKDFVIYLKYNKSSLEKSVF